ncbi:MAG: ABC transporter substrate-binding protein, partial [Gammaproteobacteria bacterium]|nr:ABC transporter substrate-binding protein [Gammaproteobacteria bacterium]
MSQVVQDSIHAQPPRICLGFMALLDAAPLIVARERGFFAAQGLDVVL